MYHHPSQFIVTGPLLLGCVSARNPQLSVNGSIRVTVLAVVLPILQRICDS